MKAFFKSILSSVCKAYLNAFEYGDVIPLEEKRAQEQQKTAIESAQESMRNSWLDKQVICRSNEQDPARVGTLVRWEKFHENSRNHIPVVKDSKTGAEYYIMGALLPYSEPILDALKIMGPREGWEWCKDFTGINSTRHAND
jgi:hypothetical protein